MTDQHKRYLVRARYFWQHLSKKRQIYFWRNIRTAVWIKVHQFKLQCPSGQAVLNFPPHYTTRSLANGIS